MTGVTRSAHAVGVTVRLGALAMVGVAIPFVWKDFRHPPATAALLVWLVVTTGLVLVVWRRTRTIRPAGLYLDVPAGLVAIVADAWLTQGPRPGWTYFAYPYTILVSITLGMACRRAGPAALLGATWGVCHLLSDLAFHHADPAAALGTPAAYLANALGGWAGAWLLRRADTEINRGRARELLVAAEIATERERLRHARALHDRVLQTLEVLAFGDLVHDDRQRELARAKATWLRRFVETGEVAAADGLAAGLDGAVEAARRRGLTVETNDAALRVPGRLPELGPEHRTALVGAGRRILEGLAAGNEAVVVHVGSEDSEVVVTVLVTRGETPPGAADVAFAQAVLAEVGGRLRVDPPCYVELRSGKP
ncbi:hypothetical protein [Lentzea sp. NPDC004782]|uniref:hypothetical protein n=1 Tax=Lentzea sp. NPDC004782 TaxID=3154458 RepID=UPI0033A8E2F2